MTDIYVDVIDNYGDMAFAVKVINTYYYEKKETHFRLFSNNKELFDIFLVNFLEGVSVKYCDFSESQKLTPSPQILNLFERRINYNFLESFNFEIHLTNFSYFSLEAYKNQKSLGIQDFHGKKAKHKNLTVENFAVSLLKKTGGVFEESEFYPKILEINYFTKTYSLPKNKKWISVFCYPETLKKLMEQKFFQSFGSEYIFLFFGEQENLPKNHFCLPFLDMYEYYSLLHYCRANIVRGENSLITALQSKKVFFWDIYKEANNAHIEKVQDFAKYLKLKKYNDNLIEAQISGNISQDFQGFKTLLQQ